MLFKKIHKENGKISGLQLTSPQNQFCYSRLPSVTLPFTQRGMFDFALQTVGKLITRAKVDFFFPQ